MHSPHSLVCLVIRPVLVCSSKCTTQMVTNEKQRKKNWRVTRCFLKTNKSWIDYGVLTKIGLSSNIDRPCNYCYCPTSATVLFLQSSWAAKRWSSLIFVDTVCSDLTVLIFRLFYGTEIFTYISPKVVKATMLSILGTVILFFIIHETIHCGIS